MSQEDLSGSDLQYHPDDDQEEDEDISDMRGGMGGGAKDSYGADGHTRFRAPHHSHMSSDAQPLHAITMLATERATSAEQADSEPIQVVHVQIQSAQQVEPSSESQRPCVVKLKKVLHSASFSQTMTLITASLAFLTTVTYSATTYFTPFQTWYQILDTIVCVVFLTELIYRLGLSANCFRFFLQQQTFLDLLIILPPLVFYREEGADPERAPYFHFFLVLSQVIRILTAIKFIEKFVFKFGDTDVSRQILSIILIVMELIYIFAGLLQALEREVQDPGNRHFHSMVYFVWVTISTVGYGDIYPLTTQGRLVLSVLITIILLLIPRKTSELVQLISKQSFYARNLYKSKIDVPHLVVTGEVRVQELRSFCHELLHPDHGSQQKNAVILQPQLPSIQMEMFLRLTENEFNLFYLQGKSINDRDLKRADLKHARAGVLLTDKQARDQVAMDQKNILTGLAMKKYVEENNLAVPPHLRHSFNLCIQLIRPESKNHYLSSLSPGTPLTDHLIIVEEIKMNLMAKSCYAPGIIAVISNLVSSSGDPPPQEASWLQEYTTGMGHQIYRVSLSWALENKTFREVCEIVYNEVNGIVFALDLEIGGKMVIRLNPSNFFINNILENKIHVYIICEDAKKADVVENLQMSSEEIAERQELEKKRDARQDRHERQDARPEPIKIYASDGVKDIHRQAKRGRSESARSLRDDGDSRALSGQNVEKKGAADSLQETKRLEQSADNALFRMNGRSEDDYWVTSHKQQLTELKQPNLQNSLKVMNHIIVLGIHDSLVHFLLPLRSKHLKTIQPIVILSQNQPNKVLETILRFPKVYFVKGSPLTKDGLLKANIHYASKCVILGSTEQQENFANQMLDAEAIFIYKTIRSLNSSVKIVTELVYHSNIDLLYDNDEICHILSQKASSGPSFFSDSFELSPLFAAGDVYISSFIDTLTAQAFFNSQIVTIVQQVLTGHSDQQEKIVNADPDLIQSNLWQVHVPENCVNKDFQFLFQHLLQQDLLSLGLYRLPGATDNAYPYVYTNPNPGTKITARDKVFVLGLNIPDPIAYEGRQLLGEKEPKSKYSLKGIKLKTPTADRVDCTSEITIQDGKLYKAQQEKPPSPAPPQVLLEEVEAVTKPAAVPPPRKNSELQLSVSDDSENEEKKEMQADRKRLGRTVVLAQHSSDEEGLEQPGGGGVPEEDEEIETATQLALRELREMERRVQREVKQLETAIEKSEHEIAAIVRSFLK